MVACIGEEKIVYRELWKQKQTKRFKSKKKNEGEKPRNDDNDILEKYEYGKENNVRICALSNKNTHEKE